jgi:uncharacterized protein YaaN involved in tellurite resistance
VSERERGDAASRWILTHRGKRRAPGLRRQPTPSRRSQVADSPRGGAAAHGRRGGAGAADRRGAARALLQELDLNDTHSILFFGSKAQERLTEVSDQMLEGVRAKDVGPAGAALSEMVTTLKGFRVDDLNPNRKPGFLARLTGKGRPVVKFLQEYEAVRDQIETISGQLERHKTKLLTDVTALDRLYAANLDYFRTLEQYIAAGEAKLAELDESTIPALAARSRSAPTWSRSSD